MRSFATVLLACLAAAAGDRETAAVRLEEATSAEARPRVTFPEVHLELTPQRPRGLRGVPRLSRDARYAEARLGARTLRLAFEAHAGALALGLLYTGGEEPAVGRARADGKSGLLVDFRDVEVDGLRVDVRLRYQGPQLAGASLIPARHMRGRATIGGGVREVILVDADGDGRYDGRDDRWVAVRADRISGMATLRRAEALRLDEPQIPFEADGRAFMLERVKPDGSLLALVLDRPDRTMEAVLERRRAEVREEYFERFRRERAAFLRRQELDETRPAATAPAPWRDLSLGDARQAARRAGKPLLVFFTTETNPWCYRYEFYTFRDREVDELLRRFVLARVDAEKEPGSYRDLGGRGLPALVPLRASGGRIRFRLRHRRPDGEVEDLAQEETMITGWQRPQELVVNLRRILSDMG